MQFCASHFQNNVIYGGIWQIEGSSALEINVSAFKI